jgi:hypothetical protein
MFCNELINLLVCVPSAVVYNFITLQLTVSAFAIFASVHQTLSLGYADSKCGHPLQFPHDGAVKPSATSHNSDRVIASPSLSSADCLPLLCYGLILVGFSYGYLGTWALINSFA